MGCDIHCYAEVWVPGANWAKVGKVFKFHYHRPGEENKVDDDGFEWNPTHTDQPYTGRNYALFAILANVRNDGDYIPIELLNRGIPEDVSEEVLEKSEKWGVDGHSHNWFTVKELLAFNWDKQATRQGYVEASAFKKYLETGRPNSWCKGVGGGCIKIISNEEMKALVESGSIKAEEEGFFESSHYTLLEWGESYRTSVGCFLTETLPALQELGPPDRVRLVFWFDN